MNSAAFLSKTDRAKLAAKGRDPDAIFAQRAKTRFDNIVAGTVSSGRKTFRKLTPVERASRTVAKLSPEDREALKAMLDEDDDAEDGSRGTVVMLEAAE
jgi:hypothetical protein